MATKQRRQGRPRLFTADTCSQQRHMREERCVETRTSVFLGRKDLICPERARRKLEGLHPRAGHLQHGLPPRPSTTACDTRFSANKEAPGTRLLAADLRRQAAYSLVFASSVVGASSSTHLPLEPQPETNVLDDLATAPAAEPLPHVGYLRRDKKESLGSDSDASDLMGATHFNDDMTLAQHHDPKEARRLFFSEFRAFCLQKDREVTPSGHRSAQVSNDVSAAATATEKPGAHPSRASLFLRELSARRRPPRPTLLHYHSLGASNDNSEGSSVKKATGSETAKGGVLDASGAGMGDDIAAALAAVLPGLSSATRLALADNRLSDGAAAGLVRAAAQLPRLAELDLSRNFIGRKTAEELAELLRRSNCSLKILSLRSSGVDDVAWAALAAALAENSSLTRLDLSENRVGAAETLLPRVRAGGAAVAAMLCTNCTLTRLDLSWNRLQGVGAEALARGLARNCCLQELNLANNALGDSACQALALALCENRALKRLDVSYTGLGPAAAAVMAHALKANATLSRLVLDGNRVGRSGGEALVRAMRLSERAAAANAPATTAGGAGETAAAAAAVTVAAAAKKTVAAVAAAFAAGAGLDVTADDDNGSAGAGGKDLRGSSIKSAHGANGRSSSDGETSGLVISLRGCDTTAPSTVLFDPLCATGSYELDMRQPYHQVVASELLRVASAKPSAIFVSLVHVVDGRARKIRLQRAKAGVGDEDNGNAAAAAEKAAAAAALAVRRDGSATLQTVKDFAAVLGLSPALPLALTAVRTWNNHLLAGRKRQSNSEADDGDGIGRQSREGSSASTGGVRQSRVNSGANNSSDGGSRQSRGGSAASGSHGGSGGSGGTSENGGSEQQSRDSSSAGYGDGRASVSLPLAPMVAVAASAGAKASPAVVTVGHLAVPVNYCGADAIEDLLLAFFDAAVVSDDASGAGEELAIEPLSQLLRLLELPSDAAALRQIMAVYDADGSGTIALSEFLHYMRATLLGARTRQRRRRLSPLCDSDGRPWQVPTSGLLRLEFREEPDADRSTAELSTDGGVAAVVRNIRAAAEEDDRRRLFELAVAADGVYLTPPQAHTLLAAVASLYGAAEAVAMLLPQMATAAEARALVDGFLGPAGKMRLRLLLGQAWGPIVGMAAGHYALDMQVAADRQAGVKLAALAARERQRRRVAGLPDTSQKGDRSSFRNARFNREPLPPGQSLGPAWFTRMPSHGIVSFDFVATETVDTDELPLISARRLRGLLTRLGLEESGSLGTKRGSGGSSGTDGNSGHSNMVSLPAQPPAAATSRGAAASVPAAAPAAGTGAGTRPPGVRDGFHELCALHWRRQATSSPGATLSLVDYYRSGGSLDDVTKAEWWDSLGVERCPRPGGGRRARSGSSVGGGGPSAAYECAFKKLLELQVALCSSSLTTDLLALVLSRMPAAEPGAGQVRAELAIGLFHRLVDRGRFPLLVDALRPDEQREVVHRLGQLNLGSPIFPDRYYRLDLSVWDEREMAKILVRLAMTEPGENWTDETYERKVELAPLPGWQLPLDWTTPDKDANEGGPRHMGLLTLWYTSAPEAGCLPNVPVRLELQRRVLCGALAEVGNDLAAELLAGCSGSGGSGGGIGERVREVMLEKRREYGRWLGTAAAEMAEVPVYGSEKDGVT